MILTTIRTKVLLGGLSLLLVPAAFAGDAGKKFNKMDTDGDGQVSRAEHAAGAQRMFAELDADRDGAITATEMDVKKDKKNKDQHEMSASDKIKMSDQNADGRLSAAEHAASAEAMFTKMDTNGDGSLSKDELEAGHKMKMKKHSS